MLRLGPGFLLYLGLGMGFDKETPPAPKQPAKPCAAEVRFADGSTVRMNLLQEHLEVMTRYGKLTVPVREIRRIEFGIHLADGVDRKIDDAVKRLGSGEFQEREAANRTLLELGALAYPAVHQASKSADLEVARRAEEILARLRAKVPAEQLRLTVNDRVHTSEFLISGRIVTPTVKAQNAYFGELQLQVTELRTIRSLSGNNDGEVTIDAAKYGSAPDQWMDTGLEVGGDGLVIVAAGQVDLRPQTPGQVLSGPDGFAGAGGLAAPGFAPRGRQAGAQAQLPGALLGRIGENGKTFVVGARFTGTVDESGKLYLHIVPGPWGNASTGSYRVKIGSGGSALTAP